MSELAIKRSKIARQISKYQKLNYFKSRRNELLAAYEDDDEEYDYTSPETNWLKQILDRSLRDNQLKLDIQQQSLLKTLRHIAFSTIKGRDIEIILVILSNILLDNITLDTKEEIVRLCLQCFDIKIFEDYSYNNKSTNISLMRIIVHTLISLAGTMNKVDQQLGVKCQGLIMRQLIKILQQIKDCLKKVEKEDQQDMLNLVSLIANTIQKFIHRQREYYNESFLIFQRNLSSFYQILKLHAAIVFNNNFNNVVRKIHLEMLQIEAYLSVVFARQKFEIYFQSKQLISIVIKEIYENRDEQLNGQSLKIFYNLLKQYENSQILVLLSMIQNDVHLQDRVTFFSKLVYKDTLSKQRMQLIQLFLTSDNAYTLIQPYFQTSWKDVVDQCYYMIKQMSNSQQIECAIGILLACKNKSFNNFDYLYYLKVIGLQGLLEYIFTTYDLTNKFQLDYEIKENIRDKVAMILYFLQEE